MTVYIRRYLLAHGAYLAVVLALLAWYGLDPGQALARFDGQHYLQIANGGYPDKLSFLPDGKPARMNIAFFPLYPLLMSLLHVWGGLPMEVAGLLIALGASLATAIGLGVLLEPLFGRRVALTTVTIWAVGIDGIVQSMLYAQPLIAAFAVWGAIAVRRRRYLLAACCAIGAGLSHSTGLGLIVVVMVGSALAIREAAHRRQWRAAIAPAAAFVLAPLGLLGFIGFLALRFHRLDAWFLAESAPGWSSKFDFGKYTSQILIGQLDTSDWTAANGLPHLVATLWLLPAAACALWLLRDTGWLPRLQRRVLPGSRVPSILTPALSSDGGSALALSSQPPGTSSPTPTPSPSPSPAVSPTQSTLSLPSPSALDLAETPSGTSSATPSDSPSDFTSASASASASAPPSPSPSPAPDSRSTPLRPRPRVPWELSLFALTTFAMILTDSGPWASKPRFILPCVALCIPPALWLERRSPRTRKVVLFAIAAVSAVCSYYLVGPSPSAL